MNRGEGYEMRDTKSPPKLVIFGDPKKEGVGEAIEEFIGFVKDKADVVANYSIEDLRNTSGNSSGSVVVRRGPQLLA